MNAESRPAPTHFDPFLHDGELRQAYQLLHKAAWDDLDEALKQDPHGWLLPTILSSEDAAVETIILARYAEARPSGRSLSLLAGAQVRDAFTSRSAAKVDAQGGARGQAFESRLQQAELVLQQAIGLQPELADPWVHLLTTSRGLGTDLQELRSRFENAHSRVPFHPEACRQYLFSLSRRAGGSDTAMFDFARWLQAEAPPGSPAMVTLPTAHLEHALGSGTPLSLTEHLTRPETGAELTPALADFIRESPSQATPVDLLTLNTYALAMTVTDRETALLVRECFRRIDNRPTSYPWTLYENEKITAVFNEVQRAQLRSATRFAT